MSIPILICDDSSFARKQMARTLPPEWDVTISYAENGLEALDAVRAGKGNVMFLDLTMPIMDGYQVLEVIKQEDLPCMVIVVSGDIQPEAIARVKQLGALEFIEKPIDPDKTRQVLSEFGIL
ncbi:MAG: response regulator [Natronospirillum sp.]